MPFYSPLQRRAAFAKMRFHARFLPGQISEDVKRAGERGTSGLRRFYEFTKTTYKPRKKLGER